MNVQNKVRSESESEYLGLSNDDGGPAVAAQSTTYHCEAGWINTGGLGCILFKNVEIHSNEMLYEYAKQDCQRHGAELVFYMCSSCSSSRCIFEGRCDAPSNIICQKQKSVPGAIEDSTPHYFDEEESSG